MMVTQENNIIFEFFFFLFWCELQFKATRIYRSILVRGIQSAYKSRNKT